MVFISFPSNITSEEETLQKKYDKLEKKLRLDQATKPEPEIVTKTDVRTVEAKDAKSVIEQLKRKGQLPQIKSRKTEFKRKIVKTSGPRPVTSDSRDVIAYEDDDLFDCNI